MDTRLMTASLTRVLSSIGVTFLATAVLGSPASAADNENKGVDHLLIKSQLICPVSGIKLGDHGAPVKGTIDGATMFLCCKGCVGRPAGKEHLAKVKANMIAAQKKCPVMVKEVPASATSVVVKGRTIFVCCPPCTKKIKADPDKYIAKVDAFLKESVKP